MKAAALILAMVVMFWLGHRVHGADPSPACCMGGNHPAASCKTCETCFYCGKKGRWGKRPENSATCVVCDATTNKGKKP